MNGKALRQGYLGFLTITFGIIGIALMVWPEQILSAVEISFETPTAKADIRADYGGCVLGITVFLAICLARRKTDWGLLCVGMILLGYATGRSYSLLIDGMPKPIIFYLLIFEVLFGGMAIAFSFASDDRPVVEKAS